MQNYKAKKVILTTQGKLKYYFGFDYIDENFVKVTIDGSPIEDFEVIETDIILENSPSDGQYMVIQRVTPTVPLVAWEDSSILFAKDMNLESLQLLHIVEENIDRAIDIGFVVDPKDGKIDAQGRIIKNVGVAEEASEAVTLDKFIELQKETMAITDALTTAMNEFQGEVTEELKVMKEELLRELVSNEEKLGELLKAQEARLTAQMDDNINIITEKLVELEETKELIYTTRQFLLEELARTKVEVNESLLLNQKDTLQKVDEKLDSKTQEMDELIEQGKIIIEATSDIDERLQENHDYVDKRIEEVGVEAFEGRVSKLEKDSKSHITEIVYESDMDTLEYSIYKKADKIYVDDKLLLYGEDLKDLRNDALLKSEGGTVLEPIKATHFETSEVLPKEIRPEVNVTRRWVEKYGLEAINEKLLTKEDIGVAQGLVDDLKAISVTTDDNKGSRGKLSTIMSLDSSEKIMSPTVTSKQFKDVVKGFSTTYYTNTDSVASNLPSPYWNHVINIPSPNAGDMAQLAISSDDKMYYRYWNSNKENQKDNWTKVATGEGTKELQLMASRKITTDKKTQIATLPSGWKKIYCRVKSGDFTYQTHTILHKPSCAAADVYGVGSMPWGADFQVLLPWGFLIVNNNVLEAERMNGADLIVYAEI